MRAPMTFALLFCLATCTGCAGYTTVAWPRQAGAPSNEFGATIHPQAGQRVRIATVDKAPIAGTLVEADSLTVTVLPDGTASGVVSVAVADISRFEVHTPTSWRPIRTAALVVGGSLATYAVIDQLTDRHTAAIHWEVVKSH